VRYFNTTALFILIACSPAPATPADIELISKVRSTAPAVDQIFKEYAAENHLPGLSYGIIAGGELVYSGSFGYSNLEEKIPASSQSLFRIASMSKSFTALAILQLRDAGKLKLDEPAETYLPELKTIDYLTTDAPRITVRHLMMHATGFPEDNPWGDRQLADTDRELMQLIKNGVSFSNVPGITYEYSNLGFALLGQIVQKVSETPFTQYMSENVFEPLGMNSTVWEYDNAPAEQLALGYGWRDGEWFDEPLLHHGSFGAMGGLISSVEDFSRYAAMHLAAWPPRSGADSGPLKRSSLREMHHPWNFSGLDTNFVYADGRQCPTAAAYTYGLGWRKDCDGRVYIRHSGGLPGFGSNWTMMPDYDLAIVSFDNRTYAATSNINVTVLDTIISSSGLTPRVVPPSDILEQRKNELMTVLPGFEAAESSGLFAENFFLDRPLSIWQEEAQSVFSDAGQIDAIGPVRALNQLRGSFDVEGELQNLRIFFTLTPEKSPQIQQLRITSISADN
jgi:CubicO group peptidase (beta-lactamase class C family)